MDPKEQFKLFEKLPTVNNSPISTDFIKLSANEGQELKKIILTIFLLLFLTPLAFAQITLPEVGTPHIQNFLSNEYGATPQCWQVLQDQSGTMFLGNTSGLLQFDGVSWRKYFPKHYSAAYSVAQDSFGRIYVGSFNELGYLAPDSTGNLVFNTFLNWLDSDLRSFGAIWSVHCTPLGVYYTSRQQIFHFPYPDSENESVTTISAETSFLFSFYVNNKLLVPQLNVGLMECIDDSLKLLNDEDIFKEKSINVMVTDNYSNSASMQSSDLPIYVIHGQKGVFQYANNRITPFSTEIDSILNVGLPISATFLPNGNLAIGTYRKGLFVVDGQGRLQAAFNEESGLPSSSIRYLFVDYEGSLWVSTNDGYSRIEISSPITQFSQSHGLPDLPYVVHRHRGILYVGSDRGVFRLNPAKPLQLRLPGLTILGPYFEVVSGIESTQFWAMTSVGDELLAGTNNALYLIDDTIAEIYFEGAFYDLSRSMLDSNRVWIATSEGIKSIYAQPNARQNLSGPKIDWVDEGLVAGFSGNLRWLKEDKNGRLWAVPRQGNIVHRVDFEDYKLPSESKVKSFRLVGIDTQIRELRLHMLNGEVRINTRDTLYRFDEKLEEFTVDSNFATLLNGYYQVNNIAIDSHQNIWAGLGSEYYSAVRLKPIDKNTFDIKFLASISQTAKYALRIYPDGTGIAWFVGGSELIRLDSNTNIDLGREFSALVRRVHTFDGDTLYNGRTSSPIGASPIPVPKLPFSKNAMRFEYAATAYMRDANNSYQYILEGFDRNWSEWTKETRKDYTNLPEGSYRFRLLAKNDLGRVGNESAFDFVILAPWFRSWWAYSIYLLLFITIVFGFAKWRSRQLLREKEALEKLVAERTVQVKAQAEKLKEMDKLKSRFFANISHEFRTPLTLIIGPLQEMISGDFKGEPRQNLGMMHRNANRLLQLVNQLLDLSKLESGAMPLSASKQDFISFLKAVVSNFESAAERKMIKLELETDQQSIPLLFNREKLEKVFYNLLSNALKFTPEKGRLTVECRIRNKQLSAGSPVIDQTAHSALPNPEFQFHDFVEIKITDSGIGIGEDQLPHIFDRFYQATIPEIKSSDAVQEFQGTGIGLAITKELVELHGGTIVVESAMGEGTTFIICLPSDIEQISNEPLAVHGEDQQISSESPVDFPETTPGTIEPETAVEPRRKKDFATILVVEDNADVRAYIIEHLGESYQILEAVDGAAGVDLALKTMPDLIISDVMMPRMDGFELCRKLKTDIKSSHIPIILLTARAEDHDKIAGLEFGADDYLSKPFNFRELKTRIHNLIELRRKIRDKHRRDLQLQPGEVSFISVEEEFIGQAKEVVEKHIGDFDFSATDFATQMMMSRMQLHRKLQSLVGLSASHFIRTIRLNRAMQLLQQKGITVTEVSYDVGFNEPAYFSKCFKEQFGKAPSVFLK